MKTTSGQEIRAADVVVATNSPVNVRVAIHSKQAPYRTYAIAAKPAVGALVDALYWDTLDPYHYVRLQPFSADEDIVIIGGEDHKSGEADDGAQRFASLERWARDRLPNLREVTHRWSGQVLEPTDFIGFIGHSPEEEHVFIVSGDSGQGVTNGLGSSPWEQIYSPSRKIQKNISEFINENSTPLKNFAEYLTASEMASVERLQPGQGRLVRSGLKKIAAGRDQAGKLHLHSAMLHPSRLRRALEFARAMLGLPLPRLPVRARRHGAQRASRLAACRNREASQSSRGGITRGDRGRTFSFELFEDRFG